MTKAVDELPHFDTLRVQLGGHIDRIADNRDKRAVLETPMETSDCNRHDPRSCIERQPEGAAVKPGR